MLIDPKGRLAGYPVLMIRRFLKRAGPEGWGTCVLPRALEIPRGEFIRVLQELESQGYVRRINEGCRQNTVKGNTFVPASELQYPRMRGEKKIVLLD